MERLILEADANPSTFHLLGHSLGAHIMSYAAKNVTGIARITGRAQINVSFFLPSKQ